MNKLVLKLLDAQTATFYHEMFTVTFQRALWESKGRPTEVWVQIPGLTDQG